MSTSVQEVPGSAALSPPQCPVCGSTTGRLKRLIEVETLARQWREMHHIDIMVEFHGVTELRLWRCADCAVLFFTPQWLVGSSWMYEQLSKLDWYYLADKWEYHAALDDLSGRGRALEVGCGSGSFMTLAREHCGLSIEGLEQNPDAISKAISKGFSVRDLTVEALAEQEPGTYDVVCSFQVLEHVERPKEFLQACCALLRRGGLLILAVPNQDGYVRHLVHPLDTPPHHMTRWTREPLRQLQAHFPLKMRRTAYEPLNPGQAENFVDSYSQILKQRRLGFLIRPRVRSGAIRFARRFGRFFRGHSIYACYVRT